MDLDSIVIRQREEEQDAKDAELAALRAKVDMLRSQVDNYARDCRGLSEDKRRLRARIEELETQVNDEVAYNATAHARLSRIERAARGLLETTTWTGEDGKRYLRASKPGTREALDRLDAALEEGE